MALTAEDHADSSPVFLTDSDHRGPHPGSGEQTPLLGKGLCEALATAQQELTRVPQNSSNPFQEQHPHDLITLHQAPPLKGPVTSTPPH